MKVKGIVILGVREFILQNEGETSWKGILKNLSDEDRIKIDDPYILPTKEYDIVLYSNLCKAIEKHYGSKCDEIFEHIGEYTAKKVILDMYNYFFKTAKHNPEKMFSIMTRAIAHISPEQWETKKLNGNSWELQCKSPIFKSFSNMINPICKRNIGGVKALLYGVGYKNIKGKTTGMLLDKEKTPVINLHFTWE